MALGSLYQAVFSLTAIAAAAVAVVMWRHRDTRGGLPLTGYAGGTAVWAVTVLASAMRADPGWSKFWTVVLYASVVTVVTSWFLFAVEYTGRDHLLTGKTLGLLAVEPVFVVLATATNDFHGFFWRSVTTGGATASGLAFVRGPGFWLHTIYSYLLVFASIALILQLAYRRRGVYRKQAVMLTLAVVSVLLANVVFIAGLTPVDVTLVGHAVASVSLMLAVRRYDLVDLAPIARDTVLDTINDGVIVLDDEERFVDINPMARQMFDLTDATVTGEYAAEVFADLPELYERFSGTYQGTDVLAVDTGHGRRFFEFEVTPVHDARDRTAGQLIVVHDITERKLREEELKNQNERLEQFANLVSHDLRNPLNVASASTTMLRMNHGDLDRLDELEQAHDRMEAIIDDVLTLAREGKSIDEDDLEPVELTDLATYCWDHVDTKEATLSVETDRSIVADRERLYRLFENLFRNALDHGPADVTITVGAIGDDDMIPSEQRGFFVADDGPGIPADKREDVLEHGYTTADEGTGLGLSIVVSIAEAHGWEIEVTESEDGGARFDVTGVPLARPTAET